jgi:hypothetical protein
MSMRGLGMTGALQLPGAAGAVRGRLRSGL